MRDIDWEILYELYRNPNMTKVANILYISQPSLTKRIKYIENEFQVAVVERTPRGIRFTKEGTYLAEQAAKYMALQKETIAGLEKMNEDKQVKIILGASYTYTKYTLSDVLAEYRKIHPEVVFSIVNDQSNILFRKVLDGSVDAAIIRGDYEGAVYQKLLGRNRACLVTKEPVEIQDIRNMTKIGFRTNDRSKEILDKWWQENFGEDDAPEEMDVGYIDFAWQLIDRNLGYCVCFLPEGFKNELGLTLQPLVFADGTPVTRNTWFVYPKSKLLPDELLQFIDHIEKEGMIEESET